MATKKRTRCKVIRPKVECICGRWTRGVLMGVFEVKRGAVFVKVKHFKPWPHKGGQWGLERCPGCSVRAKRVVYT